MSDITITSSNSMSSVANQAYVANAQTTKADSTVADDVKKQNTQAVKDNTNSVKDPETKSTSASDLDEVVKETAKKINEEKKLSKYMQEHNEKVIQERKNDLNRQNIGLAFSIDKDTENTVVKVTDLNTEKLVRQIPSEDFLKLAGFGIIAVTGVTQIVKALSAPTNKSQKATSQVSQAQGYGAMAYGGAPKKQ